MAAGYDGVPQKAKIAPNPFTVAISDSSLSDFKQLLRLSKLAPLTFENDRKDRKYGLTMEWMAAAKARWEEFDW